LISLTAPNEISAVFPKTEYLNAPTETEFDQQAANKGQPNRLSEVRILTLSMKIDNSGIFWHYAGVPWQRQIERSGFIEKQTVELCKPVGSQEDGFSILSTAQVKY